MMIGLNTEEFIDSLNNIRIIISLVSRMVSERDQHVLKLSRACGNV